MKREALGMLLVAGVLLAVGWVMLFGGRETAGLAFGGAVVALLPERQRVRQALRDAASRYGLPPEWLEAVGWVESRWRGDAVGDGGRSVGPTQIQRQTLRVNGFSGSGDELLVDPELAADWTARLMLAGARNAEGKVLARTPATLEDLGAWWNAGRQSYAELGETHRTRADYVPKLLAAAESAAGEGLA